MKPEIDFSRFEGRRVLVTTKKDHKYHGTIWDIGDDTILLSRREGDIQIRKDLIQKVKIV